MTEMSFLSSEVLSGLGTEESLGLLDDYLEVAKHFKPHGFSSDKAKADSSEWLAVDGLVSASNDGKEDAFFGTDWMLEKTDLKEFDFDALLGIDDLETLPDELLATLDDSCDLFAPLVQETIKEPPQSRRLLRSPDQVAPFTFLQPLPLSSGVQSSTPDYSFSLELGSEVDIFEGARKPDSTAYISKIPQCTKEEDAPSDHDSGICMSPESCLGSPSTSRGSPSRSPPSPGVLCGSACPKPYDPPGEKMVAAQVKGEKLDKKYRQKKRVEQEVLTGECKAVEKKNEALQERADSLAEEIQYMKDSIEEVCKARGKKRVLQLRVVRSINVLVHRSLAL
uniref:BZIP domain-containing protein n=1 Tax=Pan troglodytes TaxID=9598 RepID=A0A2I3TCC1_PANTR